MTSGGIFLFDTNAIIESVRTGTWNAISGGLTIETVEECQRECQRGDSLSSGYVSVDGNALSRLHGVHTVSELDRVTLALVHPTAAGLDPGERDLYAYGYRVKGDPWLVCSPDRAAVKLAVKMEWRDRLVSLEAACSYVGGRPNPPLREHFTTAWLSSECTKALLGL